MQTTATESETRSPHRRWRIAVLLGIGVLVNFFDRVNVSVAFSSLHAGWGVSAVMFGYLASAYNWTYTILQIPIGVALDRWGVRRMGRVATLLWSAASFASGLAMGVKSFFIARLLLGVGEAPTFPANAKAIGYWFPEDERSFATSLNDSAAKFANAIGIPILGVFVVWLGWRWSFIFTGTVSFVYFLLFWRVYREPNEDEHLSASERVLLTAGNAQPDTPPADEAHGAPLLFLLAQRQVLGATIGFAAYNYVFFLVLTWLPSYLHMRLHINLVNSALYTSVPWLVATVTDLLIGGWLVDTLVSRVRRPWLVRQAVLVGGLGFGIAIFGAAFAHTPWTAVAWISTCMGGLGAMAPVGWSVPSLIAPRNSVGRVGGIMNFATQLAAILAPVITGYFAGANNFAGAFVLAAAVLVVGMTAYALLLGSLRRVPEPA